VSWSWIKPVLLVCGAEGGTHAKRGKESMLGERLAVEVIVSGGEGFIDWSG
jgi:hypothetical protein